MQSHPEHTHYDVVVAGARVAGASTAMLLARMGFRILVVDPAERGSDTLSTHALMRPGVLQLHRWGLLDAVRDAGTPPATETTFHYGDEAITVAIKPRDGVDALYAPRRTVLDSILADAAAENGAEIVHGLSFVDLVGDASGRIRGAVLADSKRRTTEVTADLVIGADGINSRVARLAGAQYDYEASHASAVVYGYWKDLGLDGFHWHYVAGASAGAIPTNDRETCVFISVPPARFHDRKGGLESLFFYALAEVSPGLAGKVAASIPSSRLRGFAGRPGYFRRSAGPGWALVGDAGYFKDPLTAHGISDALRDAELLARAVYEGSDRALVRYQQTRDELARDFLDLTDRIASFEWDLDAVKADHRQLSREMNRETDHILGLGLLPAAEFEMKVPA